MTTTPSGACCSGLGSRGDTHSDNFEGTPRQAAVLHQAMIALLADL